MEKTSKKPVPQPNTNTLPPNPATTPSSSGTQEARADTPLSPPMGRGGWNPREDGFEIWDTGGGCTAWGKVVGPTLEAHILITDMDGMHAELDQHETCLVGAYLNDNTELTIEELPSFQVRAAVLRAHELLGGMDHGLTVLRAQLPSMECNATKDAEDHPCIAVTINDLCIVDPFVSECGRFTAKPSDYGLPESTAQLLVDTNAQLLWMYQLSLPSSLAADVSTPSSTHEHSGREPSTPDKGTAAVPTKRKGPTFGNTP